MSKLRPAPEELRDAYRYPGFAPSRTIERLVDDPSAIVLALRRCEKNGLRRVRMGGAALV